MRIPIAFALLAILAVSLCAQPVKETFALRVQGGVNLSVHTADFSGNGDIIDCGQLSGGSGLNGVAQGVLEFPITTSLGLGLGFGYAGRSASLSRENSYPIRDGVTGQEGTLTTNLELQATLSYLEIQPDLRIPLIGDWSKRTLGLIVGPRIALPLTTKFIQHETIIAPSNATFNAFGKATQDRAIASGPLTTRSSFLLGASVGLESFVPISQSLAFVPAVSADYFFSSIVNDAGWNTVGIRLEAGLRFAFFEQPAKAKVVETPPPPPPPAIIVTPVSVAISEPLFTGEVVTGNKLHATTPIVNAVFFDSTSWTVPTNYLTAPGGTGIPTDAVEAHNWILIRIASILEQNPNASVTLEGAGSTTLGLQRAQAVKQILVGLGIDDALVSVKGRTLPGIPSNADFAGGREENNRVDIFLNNAPLQQWVTTEKFAHLQGKVEARVTRAGGAPELRDGGTINVRVLDVMGANASVSGNAGEVSLPITEQLKAGKDTVRFVLEAESYGAVSQSVLPVALSTLPTHSINLETKNFEAVLRFDYNSSNLTQDVQQLLRQLVDKLPKGSMINVEGSADALGSAERNKKLSDERARQTVEFIQSLSGSNLIVNVVNTSEHFSDDTPQGRFLNRSIRVSVTTP